jgi:hypothetical protein
VIADLFVLSNGVLQLALLDKFFGGAENLLLVESKTKRHKITDSGEIAEVRRLQRSEVGLQR